MFPIWKFNFLINKIYERKGFFNANMVGNCVSIYIKNRKMYHNASTIPFNPIFEAWKKYDSSGVSKDLYYIYISYLN